jgi:hypothetical protein
LLIVSVTCQPSKKFSIYDLATSTPSDPQIGQQLLRLSSGLGWLAKAESKSVRALLLDVAS